MLRTLRNALRTAEKNAIQDFPALRFTVTSEFLCGFGFKNLNAEALTKAQDTKIFGIYFFPKYL